MKLLVQKIQNIGMWPSCVLVMLKSNIQMQNLIWEQIFKFYSYHGIYVLMLHQSIPTCRTYTFSVSYKKFTLLTSSPLVLHISHCMLLIVCGWIVLFVIVMEKKLGPIHRTTPEEVTNKSICTTPLADL